MDNDLMIGINGYDAYKYSPLFKDGSLYDYLRDIYMKCKEIIKASGVDGGVNEVDFSVLGVYEIMSKCETKEDFLKQYQEYYDSAKEQYIQSCFGKRMTQADIQLQKEIEEMKRKDDYEMGNKVDLNVSYSQSISMEKNKIVFNDKAVFMLEKRVSKILPYNWWNNIPNKCGDLCSLEYFLLGKKINYEYLIEDNSKLEKRYLIKFKDDKIFVDDEQIPKAKVIFFLKRANGTTDKIKELKKLNGRAIQILDKTAIDVRSCNSCGTYQSISLPFKAETKNGKDFKVNFMMKDFEVSYDSLVELFFRDRDVNISYPSIEKVCRFAISCGETKNTLFEHIKRIKILGGLNEDN
jgi:hypothetical protein